MRGKGLMNLVNKANEIESSIAIDLIGWRFKVTGFLEIVPFELNIPIVEFNNFHILLLCYNNEKKRVRLWES